MATHRDVGAVGGGERPAWRRSALLVFAVFTLQAVLWAFQSVLSAQIEARDFPMRDALFLQLAIAWAWAVLTPLIVWLGRRFRFDRKSWASSFAVHAVAAVAVSFAMAFYKAKVAELAGRPSAMSGTLLDRGLLSFVGWFDVDVMFYIIILGVSLAIEHARLTRERALRASQLEAQLARARLQALEMQLHPHFLFNALHTIAALVRTDQNPLAIRVVAGLGDLLRRALDGAGAPEVSLRQELEFVSRYLEIEQVRFGDRLHLEMDVSPEALDAKVPYLILQPLVENAIRHGIARRAGSGSIAIRATRDGDRLRLAVEDDGPGLPDGFSPARFSVGLSNVSARLRELHGEAGRLVLEGRPSPPGGTRAAIELPFVLAVDEWTTRAQVTVPAIVSPEAAQATTAALRSPSASPESLPATTTADRS